MRTAGIRFSLLTFLLLLFAGTEPVSAQSIQPDSKYRLLAGKSFVQSKNYYLLTLMEELPEVKKMLVADTVLSELALRRLNGISQALKLCNRDALCYTEQLKFSQAEIDAVSARLTELYLPGNPLGKLVTNHLLPSGCYVLFQQLKPVELLVKAWEQDAMGVNFALGVYAEGKKAKYPNIDSVSYNTYNGRHAGLLYNTASLLSVQHSNDRLFFSVPLSASLLFLEMNGREQAGDFEPMSATENKAAFDKIKTINWNAFKYSVIVVPGAGPENPAVALSEEGMLRCRLAAIQYRNGAAPFILVSGGKVHPYKTKFCEATEMKDFLVKKLHIPASAIIIDPHARHTTTNMRNAARIIFRYGMPFSKPGISCTTRGQSYSIGATLIGRCLKELNMAPYKNGNRLTESEIEFYPLMEALHINPAEPIDP